ncbi:MAG: hypothetical protein P4N60_12420 [Verrucomicrobiae bacterium]|nr:hypothetical protein [Verrucomicrobiae bacterium]
MTHKLLLPGLALVLSGVGHAAIIYPTGPDGGLLIVSHAIGEVRPDEPVFGELRKADVVVASPHRFYSAGVTDLISGHLLDVRTPETWWEYPIMRGTNLIGTATMMESGAKTGGTLKFGILSVPGNADNRDRGQETLAFLRELKNWLQVKQQDYELRMLNLPGLSFQAIWLHAKTDDLIIPLPWYSNPTIHPYQPYSEKQLVKILQPEAKRVTKMRQKLHAQEEHNQAAYEQAMMDYEQAHGNKCGSISWRSMSGPTQPVEPYVIICQLGGFASECGMLNYKVKITYANHFNTVKRVEVLEKVTPPNSGS